MKKHMILLCAAASILALGGCGLNDKLQTLKDSLDSVDSTTEAMVSGEKPEETDSEADNKKDIDNSAESKTETDTTDKSSDDKESGGKQGDEDSKATEKFDEILRTAYNDGILDMCKEHFMSYRNGVWGNDGIADTYDAEKTDYYFSMCDIDGDGNEELLLAWSDWCDWESYGMKFVDIFDYDTKSDGVKHEGVIPVQKAFYDSSYGSSRQWMDGMTVYDNGTITSELQWINLGYGQYIRQFKYDKTTDYFNETENIEGMATGNQSYPVVDLWEKEYMPQYTIYKADGTSVDLTFPDECDLDGDGRVYCKFSEGHMYDRQASDCGQQWGDIESVAELDVPDNSSEHEIAIEWYKLGDYVKNGEKTAYRHDRETEYEALKTAYLNRLRDNAYDNSEGNMYKNYDGIFYSETDLDKDGVPELLLGLTSSLGEDGTITYTADALRVYTWRDDDLYLAFCDDLPDLMGSSYVISNDEIRLNAGGGTGFAVYEIYELPEGGTTLRVRESAWLNAMNVDLTATYYRCDGIYDSNNGIEISEDEFNSIVDKAENDKVVCQYMYLN